MVWYLVKLLIPLAMHEEAILYVAFQNVIGLQFFKISFFFVLSICMLSNLESELLRVKYLKNVGSL